MSSLESCRIASGRRGLIEASSPRPPREGAHPYAIRGNLRIFAPIRVEKRNANDRKQIANRREGIQTPRASDPSEPVFHPWSRDLVLSRPDGRGTPQIDHVVGSPFGIFVIEITNDEG